MSRPAALPPTLQPRGLSRAQAAAFVGVSATTFDRLVIDGMMPGPRAVYGRLIWCRIEIEAAFAELPSRDQRMAQTREEWEGME